MDLLFVQQTALEHRGPPGLCSPLWRLSSHLPWCWCSFWEGPRLGGSSHRTGPTASLLGCPLGAASSCKTQQQMTLPTKTFQQKPCDNVHPTPEMSGGRSEIIKTGRSYCVVGLLRNTSPYYLFTATVWFAMGPQTCSLLNVNCTHLIAHSVSRSSYSTIDHPVVGSEPTHHKGTTPEFILWLDQDQRA